MEIKKILLISFSILAAIMLIAGIVWLIKGMLAGGIIFTIISIVMLVLCLREYTLTEFERTLK